MGLVLVGAARMTALVERLCRREYINPVWIDFATLVFVGLAAWFLANLVREKTHDD